MTITKNTITDKIETVAILDHFSIQVREKTRIFELGEEISSSFHRYVLQPNADVSTISDATVKAQFNAVMTDTVKANYQTFLEAQNEEKDSQ
tara:strand:+ start:374 stop:649 length:276 start_codon:yes stop_codon:yes gene_type:complete